MSKQSKYIIKRGNKYHYQRRWPNELSSIVTSKYMQVTLKTDSFEIAKQRASTITAMLDSYFVDIVENEQLNPIEEFKKRTDFLKKIGFRYIPERELSEKSPVHDVLNRITQAEQAKAIIDKGIITGAAKRPDIKISHAPDILINHERLKLSGRTDDEIKKYRNPILRAINNFISVHGDINVESLSRAHLIDFKDWWTDRIIDEGLSPNSANRDLMNVKKAIRVASDAYELNMDITNLTSNLSFRDNEKNKRPPFDTLYIENVLLKHEYINKSPEIRLLIFAMADTGARIKELVGLEKNDVHLDCDIPYIHIRKNNIRSLKTQDSERTIPLVGAALYAFQQLGGPFKYYQGKSDAIGAAANKYLKENNLLPSSGHSIYSLRHSFEDRMQALEPPDKVNSAIFGHAYKREKYGAGPTLEQKKKWLDKIAFKISR